MRLRFLYIALCLALGLPSPLWAVTLYRCQQGTNVVFQQAPCGLKDLQHVLDEESPMTGVQLGDSGGDSSGADSGNAVPAKSLVLHRNASSHFTVEGTINGVAVTFLVDTGATLVTVPEEVARNANLLVEKSVTASTAGGQANVQLTTIKELSLQDMAIGEVQAAISSEMAANQVLLGMNVLSKFDISQKGDELVLSPKT